MYTHPGPGKGSGRLTIDAVIAPTGDGFARIPRV